jgi:hypothetical protein
MGKLSRFREHRVRDFPQRIEPFDHGIQHYQQMLPGVKVFDIPFAALFLTDLENF